MHKQARLLSSLWSERIPFPSIDEQQEWIEKNVHDYVHNPCCYPPLPYCDDIASLIGCLPTKENVGEEFYGKIHDKSLIHHSQYRLVGHGSKREQVERDLEMLWGIPLEDGYRSSPEGREEYGDNKY